MLASYPPECWTGKIRSYISNITDEFTVARVIAFANLYTSFVGRMYDRVQV